MTLTGTLITTKSFETIELEGNEELSFSKFLDGKSVKKLNLEGILGIGGEGIVLARNMDTRENHYKNGRETRRGRDVALKFVNFEKNGDEDFLGPENEDEDEGVLGGINENGKWVESQYFKRLIQLGDFNSATCTTGGYSRPYIDFGISEIHNKYYYVIG